MDEPGKRGKCAVLSVAAVMAALGLAGQVAAQTPATNSRILGVVPNYTTVDGQNAAPLTVKQKWALFLRESSDPYNMGGILMGAALSQVGDGIPRYGNDEKAFGDRVGAAAADMTSQNFFSCFVLAPLLHQDPRYFRKGPEYSIPHRLAYSLSRVVITRQDSGHAAFNFSGVGGMVMGIALSNVYYPASNANGRVMAARIQSSLTGAMLSNLLPEFWPDVHDKLLSHVFHRKH